MLNYTIKDYYSRIRANGASATRAIELARSNLAAKRKLYDIPCKRHIAYNPASEGGERWIENINEGLRFLNYADELRTSINHKGWYTDDDGISGEVLRGAVWRLPARKGKERFLAGYADPCNEGCARVDFSTLYDDENDAARAADRFAQRVAENEREYNAAWHAGNEYDHCSDRVKEERKACLALIAAIKVERGKREVAIIICDTLRNKVKQHLETIAQLRRKMVELVEANNSAWQRDTWDAFNDGAGSNVIKS